ncbi:hypothetical protein AB0K16_22290 [Nonomuraea jabiensis]|uniref:hypothetical protein n=1 Tax=Nonomuraea jabiensis TaxID=882448 RepID=UPI003446F57C
MNNSGAANLGEAPQESGEEKRISFRTAFVVFQDQDGQWGAANDPSFLSDKIDVSKIAHPDEIASACEVVKGDVQAQKTAAMVQQVMMMAAKQAQDAALNAEIARKIKV